ncbi:16S rRNA (uracil(1498)-N(3))-methyltransferase [Nocardiopsis composta]
MSPAELSAFDAAGAVRVLLGPTVLRTSTAGVAALSVLQARCGRW